MVHVLAKAKSFCGVLQNNVMYYSFVLKTVTAEGLHNRFTYKSPISLYWSSDYQGRAWVLAYIEYLERKKRETQHIKLDSLGKYGILLMPN